MIYDKNKAELLIQRYPEGTRICLDHMEDLCPVESGTKGTIIGVDDIGSVISKSFSLMYDELTPVTNTPYTGDNHSNFAAYAMLGAAIVIIAALIITKKGKKHE